MEMTKSSAMFIVLAGMVFGSVLPADAGETAKLEILGKDLAGTEVFIGGTRAGVVEEKVGELGYFASRIQPGRALVEIKKNGKTVWSEEINAEEGGDCSLGVSLAGETKNTGTVKKSCAAGSCAVAETGSASAGAEITWTNELSEGFKTAAWQKKPLMADFSAPWCPWCRKLDKEVYTDPSVIREADNFVAVKVNIDQHKDEAKRYGIRVIPTVVFFNSDGSENSRVSKCPPAAKFCELMSRAAGK